VRVCIAFEHGDDQAALRRLQRWLSTNPKIQKPVLPVFRGELTIAHVCGIDDSIPYGRAVEEWARSVWDAYRDLQSLGRNWLMMSQGH
jgi:hypothetical protein